MTVEEIVWEDPPSKRSSAPSIWAEILAPLVERPNTWARIRTGPPASMYSMAGNLRNNDSVPPGIWDFAARKIDDETGGLWARYLGE